MESQSPREIENEGDFPNGGECYYLVDENFVAVIVHDCMEDIVVKLTCGGTRLEFNIRTDEKIFKSESDEGKSFNIKFWHVLKFLVENLTRCGIFNPKLD